MIRNLVLEAEAAEPAVRQVHTDFFAQPTLRPDSVAVADNQQARHQFGIDGRAACITVRLGQILAKLTDVEVSVHRSQQVVFGNVFV